MPGIAHLTLTHLGRYPIAHRLSPRVDNRNGIKFPAQEPPPTAEMCIMMSDDPQRIEKLARIRHTLEALGKRAIVLFADELDIHLLPKVGYQWMPKSATVKLVTPGQNQKYYLAGALEPQSGRLVHCLSPRKTNVLFRALLDRLEG